MPAIRDWVFNYTGTNTNTTLGCPLPTVEVDDLLLAILSADTGTTQQWCSCDPVQYFFRYNGSGGAYTDLTTAANNATTGDIQITNTTAAVNDAAYWGSDNIFRAIGFVCSTAPSISQTWVHEYWNGTTWATLTLLAGTITTSMAAGSKFSTYTPPGDWAKTTVNGVNAYWVRIRVSAYTSQTTRPLGTMAYIGQKWEPLFTVSNTNNLAVMYKIAVDGEVEPLFGYSMAETTNVHVISVQDVNPVTPFNGTGGAGSGYRTASNAAAVAALPQLTTTIDNSLVLYLTSSSAAEVTGVLSGPVTQEDASDGTNHSHGWGWGFLPTAGAIPTSVKSVRSGVAAGVLATVGISPPTGGAVSVPTYCAGDLSLYVDPIHGVATYNGNTAFAATLTTNIGATINGKTAVNGTVIAALDVGINSFHSMGQITGVVTSGQWAGGSLVLAAGNKPDVSGKNILCHVKPLTPKVYQNTDPITKVGVDGVAFGMASTAATAAKMWHVHGAGTEWTSAQHVPIIINDGNTTGLIQTNGSLNPASIASFSFAMSGFTIAPVFQFGSLWVLDTTTVAGGNATSPIGVGGVKKVCSSGKERMSVLQQGASQILVLQPIQFGNGGTNPTYLTLDSTAIEFPKQYDIASKQVFYCSVDNVVGLTYYAGAADTIIHTNSVVSSKSPFHWIIHASSSASATYDFNGLAVIGAGNVQLRAVTTFDGMSFSDCPTITQNSAAINNCTVASSKIISAALADMDNITNCAFTSSGTGHAIEVSGTAATITFTGNTFTGYAASNGSTGNEAIYVNIASGTVTINVSGGTTPSIRTAGATVIVNNSKSFTFTLSPSITGYEWRIYVEDPAAGILGTTELAGQETASQDNQSYAYNYTSDTDIVVQIIADGYVESINYYTLTAVNQSQTIYLIPEENA